jgi:hypothetical protein
MEEVSQPMDTEEEVAVADNFQAQLRNLMVIATAAVRRKVPLAEAASSTVVIISSWKGHVQEYQEEYTDDTQRIHLTTVRLGDRVR